jgi:phosphatidylethanolamine/phosphatidyl-N-methylethanolamine N-methyltransferase
MSVIGAQSHRLDRSHVEQAYAGWAPIYDVVFGAVLDPGRTAAVRAAERVGGRILEVGVGTGISLEKYSVRSRVVGIDFSSPMLRRALMRVKRKRLTQIESLVVMDAERLGFADASFDVVVAQFVVPSLPDPEAALSEFARVVKPTGEIVLVNHLGAETGLLRACETGLAPMVHRLGWRPEFRFVRLSAWAQGQGLRLVERRSVAPLGQFALMRFTKSAN